IASSSSTTRILTCSSISCLSLHLEYNNRKKKISATPINRIAPISRTNKNIIYGQLYSGIACSNPCLIIEKNNLLRSSYRRGYFLSNYIIFYKPHFSCAPQFVHVLQPPISSIVPRRQTGHVLSTSEPIVTSVSVNGLIVSSNTT